MTKRDIDNIFEQGTYWQAGSELIPIDSMTYEHLDRTIGFLTREVSRFATEQAMLKLIDSMTAEDDDFDRMTKDAKAMILHPARWLRKTPLYRALTEARSDLEAVAA